MNNKKFTYSQDTIEKHKYNKFFNYNFDKEEIRENHFDEFLESAIFSIIKDFHNDRLEIIAPGKTYYFDYSENVNTEINYESIEDELSILNLFRKIFKLKMKTKKVLKKVPIKFNISGKVRIIFPDSELTNRLKDDLKIYINSCNNFYSENDNDEIKKLLYHRMWVDKDLEMKIDNVKIRNDKYE